MSVTPYVVGQWVRGEKFYGRGALIEEILHGNRNCLWILGTRRIGKTSILKQLEHLTSSDPGLGYFSLFWDFQGAEEPEDLNESFAESLLDALDRLEAIGISLDGVQAHDVFESITCFRRELRSRNLTLLLLGDEVEELVNVNERAPRFLRRLRRALHSAEGIRTVLASKIKLWDLADEETSTSPFLHGFTPPLFVHGLTEEESRSLICQSKLPLDSRPRFEEATIDSILIHCNHHPYLLQLLGERVLEHGNLEAAIEEIATDQMVRHFFAVDFEMLAESERDIIRVIGERSEVSGQAIQETLAMDATALNGDLSRLEHLGFVHRGRGGGYALANYFFKRWFSELPSVHRVRGGPRDILDRTVQVPSIGDAIERQPIARIDDRYELLNRLGKGATGEVFRAQDRLLETVVAMKILKSDYCNDEEALMRLNREVILSRELSHPNILKTYHLGDDRGQRYVTMQYVDGPNLAEVIAKEAPFAPARAIALAGKIAVALAAAHKAKVLHRDIKPSNILIDEAEEPYVADFGLARLLDGPEVTRDGTFLGTPTYASPEQVKGGPIDLRSDLYALGVVLFEMVCGRRPFRADYSKDVLKMQLETEPPNPRELRPSISEALSDLILRLLAKDPDDRFQTADELHAALAALEG